MMFSDSENIEPDLVGVLDLLNQMTQALRRAERPAGVIVRRRKTINADLKASLQWSVLFGARSGAPVDSSCLNREIYSGPRREVGRLPARYFICERNSVVRIRA